MSALPAPSLRLRSLGEQPPPPELAADLRLLAGFSAAARASLWSVLGPCLTEPIPRGTERALDDFAARHGIPGDSLARAVRACRALVRGAALLDLPPEALGEDAKKLCPEDQEMASLLLAGYGAAKAQVREVAIRDALGNHGRVLEGFDWRLDHVAASSGGGRLRFPLVVLTLKCRDQGREERITLQATPDRLRELQALCQELLGPLR